MISCKNAGKVKDEGELLCVLFLEMVQAEISSNPLHA